MWGQRDYWLYPLGMGIPTTEVEVEAKEEVEEEERQWIGMERPHERDPTRGFGRGYAQRNFGRGNGRGYLPQGPLDRNERYNQAGEWSDSAIEGRRGMILICLSLQPKADIREIYSLQPLPHQKIGSLQIGVVKGQDFHMRNRLHRMFP